MALGNSSIKRLRKIIKRRDHPRRKLEPKRVKGEERPKYFRSPLPAKVEIEPSDQAEIRDTILRTGCSYGRAVKLVLRKKRSKAENAQD